MASASGPSTLKASAGGPSTLKASAGEEVGEMRAVLERTLFLTQCKGAQFLKVSRTSKP
ncbi:MAG: hypothetical protein ACMVP2_22820 [Imperialibacter sp.]|uniref:hypothetical protein n=1 Tax=Imperialibacter sp. TaxID=2038411 RepID=UPI003A8C22C8